MAQPCAICAAQLKDPDAGWYFLTALLVSRMVFRVVYHMVFHMVDHEVFHTVFRMFVRGLS